jgi:uncharacterized membrane protein YczE
MSIWVMIAFGCACLLALILLFLKGPSRWYWHILSVLVGLGVGLWKPLPAKLNTPQGSMIIGIVFTFLMVWGVAAPLFRGRRHST